MKSAVFLFCFSCLQGLLFIRVCNTSAIFHGAFAGDGRPGQPKQSINLAD